VKSTCKKQAAKIPKIQKQFYRERLDVFGTFADFWQDAENMCNSR
jgi:hypothetical protein